MRRPSNNVELATNAIAQVNDEMDKKLAACRYVNLLRALCTVLDLAGDGQDIFLTLGTTRNKSAFVLQVTWDGEKTAIYGTTADELDAKVVSLLDE